MLACRLLIAIGVIAAHTGAPIALAADPPGASSAVVVSDEPISVLQTMQGDASLADVTFVDQHTGWAVGDRGVIWHTADGGKTWSSQTSGVTCRLACISFLDRRHGWAAGGATQPYSQTSRGVVLATNDGGQTWTKLEQPTLPAIEHLRFFDSRNGIAAGSANSLFLSGVYTTHDGGTSWQPLPCNVGGQWLAADFPDLQSGAVAGTAGRMATLMRRRVVDSPVAMSSTRAYRALRLLPPTGGWLVGDGGLVMTTGDLGNTWQTPPTELPESIRENFDFHAVAARGPHVWVAGAPGSRVFHSSDGGHSWQTFNTGQRTPLRALAFVDENSGCAVGDLGTILATADGGRTWQVARRGGERAALLLALASETDVPLELVGEYGGEEGYLTTVSLLHPVLDAGGARSHEALLLAGATATDAAWQFSLPRDDTARTPEELLAELDRAHDGRAVERLTGYLVRQIRTWRPDVVVTQSAAAPQAAPLAALVEQLVDHALQAAGDPRQCPALAADAGLDPWQAKKVYGVLPPGAAPGDTRDTVRIAGGRFAPRLGATLADWAEPARRLVYPEPTAPSNAIELQTKRTHVDLPDGTPDLFAGIRLAPGGEARRRLANLPSDDADRQRRLAQRRRQMRMLIERTQGNAAWAAQVSHLTDDLDPASAGELLFDLADGYRAAGKLDLAADTYSSLARRMPEHPLVEPALRWLVQFYASSETAQRLADRQASNYRTAPTDDASIAGVRQASAVATLQAAAAPVIGLSHEQRLERAVALGRYLESARPALYADPSIRFPLVVAERQRGYANPAQRYFLSLRSLPENDPWRRCGATEEWFAHSTESDVPPPKRLGHCRRAAKRPHLDGKLDDAIWKTADHLPLEPERGRESFSAGHVAGQQGSSAEKDSRHLLIASPPEVCFAYDAEFLYLAIRVPKAKGVNYAADDRPRPRDADLSEHDRVTLRLDVDRDYMTAFELAVDSRGWTHDACWKDATWNPAWFVAAAADDESWTIEAAVPLAELVAEPPAARHVWAVSLVRSIPRGDDQTWSGEASSADSPERFGLLIFD